MCYFTYPWHEGELESLVNQSSISSYRKDERFFGPLIPFLGGVLIGGLFLPRPNPIIPYGPMYPVQPVPYIQPSQYINEVPSYSVPVNHSINK